MGMVPGVLHLTATQGNPLAWELSAPLTSLHPLPLASPSVAPTPVLFLFSPLPSPPYSSGWIQGYCARSCCMLLLSEDSLVIVCRADFIPLSPLHIGFLLEIL